MKTIRKYGRRRTDGVRALVELLKDIIILAGRGEQLAEAATERETV